MIATSVVSEDRASYSTSGVYLSPCYYCGVPADTIDHVIPQSLLADMAILGDELVIQQLYERHKIKTVPACRECNSALGAQYFSTLGQRKLWLKEWLRRRYKRVLVTPEWTEDELAVMGIDLRGYILARIEERRLIRRRLAWASPAPEEVERPRNFGRFVSYEASAIRRFERETELAIQQATQQPAPIDDHLLPRFIETARRASWQKGTQHLWRCHVCGAKATHLPLLDARAAGMQHAESKHSEMVS